MKEMTLVELSKVYRTVGGPVPRAEQAKRVVAEFVKSGFEAAEVMPSDFDSDCEFDTQKSHYFQGLLMRATKEMKVNEVVKAVTSNSRVFLKRVGEPTGTEKPIDEATLRELYSMLMMMN